MNAALPHLSDASGPASTTHPRVVAGLLALRRPLVMGILNVTPDSFSDGGAFLSPDAAVAHAERMVADGADTMKAAVAAWALDRGARIVNDVWGLQRDPDMADVVARHRVPVIVMHNRET